MSTNAVVRMETFPELQVADASAADPFAVEVDDALFEEGMQRIEERLAREYPQLTPEAYLERVRRAVERGRADIAAGRWRTHAEVEADFAARHARVMAERS